MKEFFGIESDYRFEWNDVSALLTLLNVMLIVAGWHWAPIIGIVNIAVNLILGIINHCHINLYIMNIALLVMNIYFLS